MNNRHIELSKEDRTIKGVISTSQIILGLGILANATPETKLVSSVASGLLCGSGVNGAKYALTTNAADMNQTTFNKEYCSGAVSTIITGLSSAIAISTGAVVPMLAIGALGGLIAKTISTLVEAKITGTPAIMTRSDVLYATVGNSIGTVITDAATLLSKPLIKAGAENVANNMLINGATLAVGNSAGGASAQIAVNAYQQNNLFNNVKSTVLMETAKGLAVGAANAHSTTLYPSNPVVSRPTTTVNNSHTVVTSLKR